MAFVYWGWSSTRPGRVQQPAGNGICRLVQVRAAEQQAQQHECVLSNTEALQFLKLSKQDETGLVAGDFSLDLGCRSVTFVNVLENGIALSEEDVEPLVTWKELKGMTKKGKVGAFLCYPGTMKLEPERIHAFSETTGRAASLYPVADGTPPTAVLGGFGMHRFKSSDPGEDTRQKIKAFGGSLHGKALDVCTGLGYTAIELAAVKTITEVLTIELDPAMIGLQDANPWSQGLRGPKIERVTGDAVELLPTLPSSHYQIIVHDPPANAMAGELYSLSFYKELYRVCSGGGRVFHYIGDPVSKESGRLFGGVTRRLLESGFSRVTKVPRAYGVVAAK